MVPKYWINYCADPYQKPCGFSEAIRDVTSLFQMPTRTLYIMKRNKQETSKKPRPTHDVQELGGKVLTREGLGAFNA